MLCFRLRRNGRPPSPGAVYETFTEFWTLPVSPGLPSLQSQLLPVMDALQLNHCLLTGTEEELEEELFETQAEIIRLAIISADSTLKILAY